MYKAIKVDVPYLPNIPTSYSKY